ncbi:hypothetical protein Tco_0216693 [Tanacetum coccineum]
MNIRCRNASDDVFQIYAGLLSGNSQGVTNGDSEEDNTDSEGEDTDFVVDEDHMMNKVGVDMNKFISTIDKGLNGLVEVTFWICWCPREKKEVCEDVIKSWDKCVVLKGKADEINVWHNPNNKEEGKNRESIL